jgi:hypothetical protein
MAKAIKLEKMTPEEAEKYGFEIGKQVGEITEKAKKKIDKLLKQLNLESEIQINFKKVT